MTREKDKDSGDDPVYPRSSGSITIPFTMKALYGFILALSGVGAVTGYAQWQSSDSLKSPTVVIDTKAAAEIARVMSEALKESQLGVQSQIRAMVEQGVRSDEWCQRMTDKLAGTLSSISNTLSHIDDRLDRIEKSKGSGS